MIGAVYIRFGFLSQEQDIHGRGVLIGGDKTSWKLRYIREMRVSMRNAA